MIGCHSFIIFEFASPYSLFLLFLCAFTLVAQSFWLLLEIIDIVTDFIAVDNVLKYSFLSRFFTVYIVLVSLATVLSVIVIYYRGRALYDVRMFRLNTVSLPYGVPSAGFLLCSLGDLCCLDHSCCHPYNFC